MTCIQGSRKERWWCKDGGGKHDSCADRRKGDQEESLNTTKRKKRSFGKIKNKINLDYDIIGAILRIFCTGTKDLSLREDGPFGQAAKELHWKNTHENRYHLKKIWTNNRGDVQLCNVTKPTSSLNDDNPSMDDKSIPSQSQSTANKVSHKLPGKRKSLSLRRNRTPKIPFSPSAPTHKDDTYCICKTNYKMIDGGRMIECEECKTWYHFSCLKLDPIPTKTRDSDIRFVCGRDKCSSKNQILTVKGKSLASSCIFENSKTTTNLNEDKEKPLNIPNKSSECSNENTINTLRNEKQPISTPVEHINKKSNQNLRSKDILTKKISDVLSKARKTKEKISKCNFTEKDKEYLSLNEKFMVLILELDSIEPGNDEELRLNRKTAINEIQSYLEVLDKKLIANNSSFKSEEFSDQDTDEFPPISDLRSTSDSDDFEISLEKAETETFITDNDATESCHLDKETIGKILHFDLPEKFFSSNTPDHSSFYLSSEDLSHLYKVKHGRMYKKGQWQHIFTKGMAESNRHCVFIFDRHQISSAKRRNKRQSTPYFKATAHCKFSDCTVTADLKMWEQGKVDVLYRGQIIHNIHEEHARPIRGKERDDLKEKFRYGSKPLRFYLDTVKAKDTEELVSGNCNGMGKDSQVFRQISHESKNTGRRDENVMLSLVKSFEEESKTGKCFIQKISLQPCYILYWSEEGLYLYHRLAPKDVIFWDATGSVVRRSDNGKQFLYYEMALRHPVKGKMGLPVSAMLTEDNSLPAVQDWVARFRHEEKKLFGHGNVCQPKIIISDESWVFILAALKEFNTESLPMFLDRSWRTFCGEISNDYSKTIIHLCTSHFMNKVRKYCKENYRRNAKLGIYMISLLLNCRSFSEADEVLHDIIVTLYSTEINERNRIYIERLFSKINEFDTGSLGSREDHSDTKILSDHNYEQIKPGFYTEEDFTSLAVSSSFKQWGQSILEREKRFNETKNGHKNPYHSETFLLQIINRYIPIFPLWGSFMLNSVDTEYVDSKYNTGNIPRTQSTIENRFRILKHIGLNGKKNSRLDNFSEDLKHHTIEIQRTAAITALKSVGKIKRKRKSTKTIRENWNKKQAQNESIANNVGVFQQPPAKKLKVTTPDQATSDSKEYVCPMVNLGSTCWFNSTMQAIAASKMSFSIIDFKMRQPLNVDKEVSDRARDSLIQILEFMENNKYRRVKVPRGMIMQALQTVSNLENGLGSNVNQQHDANEFYTTVFTSLADDIGENLEIKQTLTCIDCGKTSNLVEHHIQCLSLDIPDKPVPLSTQELLKNYFDHELREKCSNCKGILDLKQHLSKIPNTLVLGLKRVDRDPLKGILRKNERAVKPDKIIDIAEYTNNLENTKYRLRSIICHHGRSYDSGHYTTLILDGSGQGTKISDSTISASSLKDTERTCYLMFYDRIEPSLPHSYKEILKCIMSTKGMKLAVDSGKCFYSDIETISDGQLEWLVARQSGFRTTRDCSEFIDDLLACLLDSQRCGIMRSGTEYFNAIVEEVMQCSNCHQTKSKTVPQDCILSTSHMSNGTVAKLFEDKMGVCPACCSGCLLKRYVSWLPFTLIMRVEHFLEGQNLEDIESFDLQNLIHTAMPLISEEYALSHALVESDSGIIILRKHQNSFSFVTPAGNVKPIDSNVMTNATKLLLFYDLRTKCAQLRLPTKRHVQEADLSQTLKLPQKTKQRAQTEKFQGRKQNRYFISQNDISQISKNSHWLTSDQINMYMDLVESSSPESIHAVDAGWYSHRLVGDGQEAKIKWGIFKTESETVTWMKKSKVLIPINIRNIHWIFVVVDVTEKVLYYCDSLGNRTEILLFQILRYLCYESLVKSCQKIDISEWRIVYYCEQNAFPKQVDGSSCGVYVCEMAKAITFRKKIPKNATPLLMRNQVARELMSGVLEC